MSKAVTYGNYLKIDELLSLQPDPARVEHDEMLFVVIHQVYELWFKQVLHELDRCSQLLETAAGPRVVACLARVLTILKTMVAQIDVLETMTPTEFLTFRTRLESASGFQSDQFRQLEFVLGKKSRDAVERFREGSRARNALEQRWARPALWDSFMQRLHRHGYHIPEALLKRNFTEPVEPSPQVQDALVQIYRRDPGHTVICERLVDLDEGVQEWRYRHVKMVERTIGSKQGTGGSEGAAYLVGTTHQPSFPDLWEIRVRL